MAEEDTILPSIFSGGNTHTLLNNGQEERQGIFDAAWDVATKWIPLSIASGASQLYNIVPSIGKLAGMDVEEHDFAKTVQEFDTDLGKYYNEHKMGTDALGFVLSSIVPGMGGIKVLNAGQKAIQTSIATGKVGANGPMSAALGLLAPQREKYVDAAIKSFTSSGNVFSLKEANTLRALGAGLWQNTLEGAAFTIAVNTTMFNSPVLDDRSVGDLAADVLVGGALGGVVGGAISGVISTSAIKRGIVGANKELAPFGVTNVVSPGMSESDKIIINAFELERVTGLDPASVGPLADRAKRLRDTTKSTLVTDIRDGFQKLSGDDKVVAQYMHDTILSGSASHVRDNLLDSVAISRVGQYTSTEAKIAAVKSKLAKNGDDMSALTPEESDLYRNTRVTFIKLRGRDANSVTDERPAILELADRLGPGESLKLTNTGLQVGSKHYAMADNPNLPFNMLGASVTETKARYAWASLLPKWVHDPANVKQIHINDIPLLTKALDDGLEHVRILPESGLIDDVYSVSGKDNLRELIKRQKATLSTRLVQADTMPLTPEEFVEKASSLLGINFNLLDRTKTGLFQQISGKLGNNKAVTGDAIVMSVSAAKRKSLMSNIAELKRLEGHAIFQSLVSASGAVSQNLRMLSKDYTSPIMREVMELSQARHPALWKSVKPEQIARRRDPAELFASAFSYLSQNPNRLAKMPEFDKFAGHLIRPIPQEVLDAVATKAGKFSFAEIAAKLDLDENILRGVYTEEGMFARAADAKRYQELAAKAGTREVDKITSIDQLPSFVKVITKSSRFEGLDGHQLDAMATMGAKAKLQAEAINRATTQTLGEVLPDLPESLLLAGDEAGPGFVSSSGLNYGSKDMITGFIGQRSHNLVQNRKTEVSDLFTPTLSKVGNNTEAAIEWSMLQETIRGLPGIFKLDKVGSKLVNADGVEVPIRNADVLELAELHIGRNGKRTNELGLIRSAEGMQFNRDPDAFYPIPRNLKDTPHFAFVVDDTVTGTGHSSMIYAKDGASLEVLKQKVLSEFPEFKVLTKDESEAYFKSRGAFEYERTINQNYMNDALARKGISSSPLPITDPRKIVSNTLDWHLARETGLVREAVSAKYARQMEILRVQAEPHISAAKSVFGYLSPAAYAENAVNNPATNTMKQMLDIQKMEEYPFWTTANKALDEQFSKVADSVSKLWEKAVHPEQLLEINQALNKAGYKGPLVDDALYEAMNGAVPRGQLTSIVAKMNGLIGTIALRADPMNALNNVIGHAVLYGTEAKAVINSIQKGSADGAGELAKLSQLRLPGTDSTIFSHQKILAKSLERWRTNPELKEYYKKNGFITSIMDQYDQTLDHIAIRAGDTAKSLDSRVAEAMQTARGLGNKAEVLTGNKVAEEFNRFLAADFMKQITDIAVKHGVMDEATSLAYINTFVNRTQGNFLASQRPVLFQGPVGQAIGLFQTYQFNLIQQLVRHIGDGNSRNAMTMMGLQGTIFGLNGLPAFNAINTHLVGNAGGNKEHTDLYQAIFNGAGQEAGEWLAYGALSNMLGVFDPSLKSNLYSRGDINPRSLTLVPTDPSKIPIYQATSRFFSNISEGVSQLAMGADLWPTVLRAVEHNGLSRPLAGMAQVFGGMTNESGKVIATNQQGNLLMAHDTYTLVSMGRMLGAKPMDESMMQDAMYRINSYRANDAAKRQGLGEAIKTNILSGGEIDQDQLDKFASAYAKYGGKQDEFNQFMARQYRNANTTQAEQLRQKLSSSYSSQVQQLMGGEGSN